MKSSLLSTLIFILLSLRLSAQCGGPNLVVNGNFSAGNTGFFSAYTYNPGSCYVEGEYSIATSGSAVHSAFCTTGDHTTGSGLYMIVNGSPSITNVWCQNMAVSPGTWYCFSFWGTNVCVWCGDTPQFSVSFNGTPAADPCATFTFNTTCSWKYYEVYWHSGSSTSVTICILNLNTYAIGNDFAIDDIEFRSCITSGGCTAFLPVYTPILQDVKQNQSTVALTFTIDEVLLNQSKIFVERSTLNNEFEEIGEIKSDNLKIGSNLFVDRYPIFNQEMHYRIKAIRKDGSTLYSNVKSIVVKNFDEQIISLFPNPLPHSQPLMLEYTGDIKDIQYIVISDIAGKVLYRQDSPASYFVNNRAVLPVRLSPGCYSVTVNLGVRLDTQKIVVLGSRE